MKLYIIYAANQRRDWRGGVPAVIGVSVSRYTRTYVYGDPRDALIVCLFCN